MSRTTSIRKALLSNVTLLALVPMLTAMIVSVAMFHLDTSERIRRENKRVAQTVSTAVDLFLARPVTMLTNLRDDLSHHTRSGPASRVDGPLDETLQAALDTDPLFESLQLIDASGRTLAAAGPEGNSRADALHKQNFSENGLFRKVVASQRVGWSEPFVSLRTGESVISLGLPWQRGMILGTMNLSYLCKLVEPTRTNQNAYAFIVSPAGRLIAHPDRSLVGEKEAFISIPQITAGFQGTSGTYAFTLAGRKVIGTVLPFVQNDWVIVSVHDKELSFATLYGLERLLALFAVGVLAFVLFFAYRRVARITAPLQALTDLSRKMASGETSAAPDNFDAYEEIHDLYDNFLVMVAAVEQREQALRERNRELATTEEELLHQVDEYWKTYNELMTEKVKLESILASMGEGLSIQDLDYRVILQNDTHRNLIGDAVGKYCYEAYGHGSAVCSDCPLKLAYDDGTTHVKLRHITHGEAELFLEFTASPLRNSQHEVIGGIEVVRDVTARVRADREIRKLNQELEARVIERTAELEIANRELESFSYSVSHDLRAPLRHINSFSIILESEYGERLEGDGKYYLSRITAGCTKMGMLIDDLLELSQVTRRGLRTTKVNLSSLVQAIASSLSEREPERTAEFIIEPDLRVLGDERLLEVMLTNLIGNAWKYSSQKPATRIAFGCDTAAGDLVYFIRDNGAGFDSAYTAKLFAPFHRLHGAEFEGSGIGLAIVQRIINRHGGKIWAEGVPGEGATFFFTLNLKAL